MLHPHKTSVKALVSQVGSSIVLFLALETSQVIAGSFRCFRSTIWMHNDVYATASWFTIGAACTIYVHRLMKLGYSLSIHFCTTLLNVVINCLWNTDVDHLLDVTKTWAEAELQSEPCIVHMRYKVTYETVELLDTDKYSTYIQVQTLSHILCRPWDSKKVKIREEIDFGVVEDAELGQQMYQVSVYHIYT